jgi:hypothetical protein
LSNPRGEQLNASMAMMAYSYNVLQLLQLNVAQSNRKHLNLF